ncbi:MAG: flagellar filament capping protein FliD [bacterium]
MSVSLLGMNSNLDSQGIVSQLVKLEVTSKVKPLETKKTQLNTERTSVNTLRDRLTTLKNLLSIKNITSDASTLISNSVNVSNKDKATASVSGRASPQTFDLKVLKLATNSSVKSSTYLNTGVTGASDLSTVNFKDTLVSGSVTINGQTAVLSNLTETATVKRSASQISNGLITSDLLSKANLNGVTSITEGSVTINGTTASTSGLTDVQSVLNFFTNSFTGVGASLVNGSIKLTGITTLGNSADSSNLLNALGLSTISSGTVTGSQKLNLPKNSDTLSSLGINGTVITINGTNINFNPNTDTISSLITTINNNTNVGVTAAYNTTTGKFSLTNKNTGASAISTSSIDSNIGTIFNLSDETLGTDTDFQDILDFLNNNFSGVAASFTNGKVSLSGVTSMGSSGNTSNLLSALGLSNARINAGSVTGIQNLSSPKKTALLSSIGVTGTSLTINGKEITFNPNTDTIDQLIQKINNNGDTKVKASYDTLNGTFNLKNTQTGALSIPLSSSNSNILSVLALNDEDLGDNAEFQISTQNNGATLVSNSNTVSGIIAGINLELKAVTETNSPVRVTISEDSNTYKNNLDAVLKQINDTLSFARGMTNKLGKRLDSSIKALLGTAFDSSDSNRYKSLVDIGFKSTLNAADNKFSGYSLDSKFSTALAQDPNAVNKLLYGKTGTGIGPFDNGSSGVLVQLDALLDTYVNSSTGIIQTMSTTFDSRQKTLDSSLVRAKKSVDDYEDRLKKQYAKLDSLNAGMQQQQAAVSSLSR